MENNPVSKIEYEELKKQFTDLKKVLDGHRHTGKDGTQGIGGEIRLSPSMLLKHGRANHLDFHDELANTDKYLVSVGGDVGSNFGDTTENSQLNLEHQPSTNGSTNQTFYYGFRPPLWIAVEIPIVSGTATITDVKKNWTPNSLVGAYIDVYDSSSVFKETRVITANTNNTITVDTNFTFTDNAGSYIIFMPVYLGSANWPWRRLYVMSDIRFGRGTSGGTDVIYMKFGSGSPEGVITARIGSLYMRTNGGVATTFYVKESGTGNTGWIAFGGVGAKFEAYLSSAQSIPQNTDTDIVFNTENFDSDSAYNNATGIFTAPKAGYYLVTIMTGFDNVSAGKVGILRLYKNAGAILSDSWGLDDSAQNGRRKYSRVVQLAANDTLKVTMEQDTVGSINTLAGSVHSYFGVFSIK